MGRLFSNLHEPTPDRAAIRSRRRTGEEARAPVRGAGSARLRLWDAATGKEIAVLRGHDDQVRRAAFSRDGKRVVTASHDRTARVWDAATGQAIAVLRGHDGEVTSAAFSPDGARVVTASEDRTARVWDAATGQGIAILVNGASTPPVAMTPRRPWRGCWQPRRTGQAERLPGLRLGLVDGETGEQRVGSVGRRSAPASASPSRGPGNGILWAETGGRFQAQNAGERPEFGSQTANRLTNRAELRGFLSPRKPRRFAGTAWWWTQSRGTSLRRPNFSDNANFSF